MKKFPEKSIEDFEIPFTEDLIFDDNSENNISDEENEPFITENHICQKSNDFSNKFMDR